MRKLKALSKKELDQQLHADAIYLVLFILTILCFSISWAQYTAYKNDSSNLIQIQQRDKRDGANVDQVLAGGSSTFNSSEGTPIVKELKDAGEKVKQDLIEMAPRNNFDHILGSSMFIIFPITMVIYTISYAYRELKNNQLKIKARMNSIQSVILSKMISLGVITFLSLLFICLSSLIFQLGFNNFIHIPNKLALTRYLADGQSYLSQAPVQFLSVFGLSLIAVIVSYYLTLLLKRRWLVGILMFGYFFGVPVLGPFDFKQNALRLYSTLFHQSGTFTPVQINGDFTIIGFVGCCLITGLIASAIDYIVTRNHYLTHPL
ncbi:ABC transporter permease [Lentilactobacillus parakefiri]|uniref:ABC transporter permease n=1 Tax=Lentilactobacillus parakefiri TaxID=152332 RepID=A0A269YIX8_9LACO|nr:ABC transporter permease [Lentilactobacillus parakefiri]PAK84596.1 ABC transporter permease [Lentilactobacillus parakefiri]